MADAKEIAVTRFQIVARQYTLVVFPQQLPGIERSIGLQCQAQHPHAGPIGVSYPGQYVLHGICCKAFASTPKHLFGIAGDLDAVLISGAHVGEIQHDRAGDLVIAMIVSTGTAERIAQVYHGMLGYLVDAVYRVYAIGQRCGIGILTPEAEYRTFLTCQPSLDAVVSTVDVIGMRKPREIYYWVQPPFQLICCLGDVSMYGRALVQSCVIIRQVYCIYLGFYGWPPYHVNRFERTEIVYHAYVSH